MPLEYSATSRALQDRFDTRRLADRLAEVKVHHEFTEADRAFISARDSSSWPPWTAPASRAARTDATGAVSARFEAVEPRP